MSEPQPQVPPPALAPSEPAVAPIPEPTPETQSPALEFTSPSEPAPSFKVYKPSNSYNAAFPAPLPDEYFKPTASDLKQAQAQLTARVDAMTNAPLQLKATRDAAEKAKKDRWPTTTIRIKFSDRTQLEQTFPSTSKIRVVYAFVRESLREDVQPIKFLLYQPPKRELKVSDPTIKDKSLVDLNLAPTSVLLVKFLDEKLNGSTVRAPLQDSILAQAIDLPKPPSQEASQASGPGPSTGPSEFKKMVATTTADVEKKMSKWLKGMIKK